MLFERFKKAKRHGTPEAVAAATEPGVICAPVSGRVVPMSDVPDPVFSSGTLGTGAGIWPTEEIAYAPISGTVSATMGHAIGIAGDDGVEVLVHVGLDTVGMEGRGFIPYVRQGERVAAGQPILGFSKIAIAAAGHEDIVVVALTNAVPISLAVEPNAETDAGARLITVA